ncbi:MAG: hypothetical protein IH621_16265, partial [Krumholzibacteria bacterium]|nr:hypothetical protein [Candidatus Krumholzibacteria bacterium]
MAKKIPALIQLSTAELKRLLAARERIDVLEQEQARLLKSLSAVESELGRLLLFEDVDALAGSEQALQLGGGQLDQGRDL